MVEPARLNTSKPVVLLTPGFHGHGVARSLGRLGVSVYAVHADAKSPVSLCRYIRSNYVMDFEPEASTQSVEFLLELGARVGHRPLLLPTDDKSCLLLADEAKTLSQVFTFPHQPSGLARRLSNKESMYYLCREYSIPTPETVFRPSRPEVLAFASTATFPVMLKGIYTVALMERTGLKMKLVHDADDLIRTYDRLDSMTREQGRNLMIQEYIPGGSDCVWMFDGYFDSDSRCLFGLTGQKLRQYPAHMGVTSLGVLRWNQVVVDQTKDLMQRLGYRGILDLGYKYDARTGEYKLLDVNPRIGSTFRLFVDTAGNDVARALYLNMTGQSVQAASSREGRKWVVENFDLISSAHYSRDGSISPRDWLRSYQGIEEASWFAMDDMKPFFGMWWRSLQHLAGEAIGSAKQGHPQPSSPPLRIVQPSLSRLHPDTPPTVTAPAID